MRTNKSRWMTLMTLAAAAVLSASCGEERDPLPKGDIVNDCNNTLVAACEDDFILSGDLRSTVAPGGITTTMVGAHYVSHVDATAGGMNVTDAYVYGKFSDARLDRVAIDDLSALSDLTWDLAFRRYVIRTNGGYSGPGCTRAIRMPDGTAFDNVISVPSGATYREDTFFTDNGDGTCTMIPDAIGAPDTALAGYYAYGGCVKMAGTIFILELANGHHIKLEVTHYYGDAAQAECQSSDMVTTMPSGSGNIKFKWAYID